MMDLQLAIGLATALISALLSVNAFFIKKLVEKIDTTAALVGKVQIDQQEMKADHKSLSERVRELSDLNHRLQSIEKEHAIFAYIMREQFGKEPSA